MKKPVLREPRTISGTCLQLWNSCPNRKFLLQQEFAEGMPSLLPALHHYNLSAISQDGRSDTSLTQVGPCKGLHAVSARLRKALEAWENCLHLTQVVGRTWFPVVVEWPLGSTRTFQVGAAQMSSPSLLQPAAKTLFSKGL